MSRNFYCAQCGTKLEIRRKAIPQKGIVVDLVEPHTCIEAGADFNLELLIGKQFPKVQPTPTQELQKEERINKMFEGFDFVQKLNKAVEVEHPDAPGDLRPKSQQREELVTNTAPPNLLNSKGGLGSAPEREDLDE